MLLQLLLTVGILGGDATYAGVDSQLPTAIRSEDREIRAEAFQELRKRLERGDSDLETITTFVLTGLETDHVLRMEASYLADLLRADAIPHLVRALVDPRAAVRARASIGLGAIGPEAKDALPRLLTLVAEDKDAATSAGVAISEIDSDGSTFPEFLRLLKHSDLAVRLRASRALDDFDDDVRPLIADLLPLLNDPDENQRYRLLIVVANAKSTDASVVGAMIDLLQEDPSSFVRSRVAREFWEMGHNRTPIPDDAHAALVTAFEQDGSARVREEVAKALSSNRLLIQRNHTILKACSDPPVGLGKVCHDALQGEFAN